MFCKIYLHSGLDNKELESKLLYWLDAKLDTFTIITNSYEISLCENDEFSIPKSKDYPDGFLYFRYFLEIESTTEDEEFKSAIAKFLSFLWKKNIPAIAACDFEDELPEKGGYKSLNIPWTSKVVS